MQTITSRPHVSACGLKDTGQEGVGKTVKATCLNPVGQHMNVARYTLAPYARPWSRKASRPQSTGSMLNMFAWNGGTTNGLQNEWVQYVDYDKCC